MSLTRTLAKAKKRRGPNAQPEPRGQSQMRTDARGGSSLDFTEDGRKPIDVQIASAQCISKRLRRLVACFP